MAGGVAFVTGAASGIGAAIVQRLAELGYRVVATDVAEEALRAAARGLGPDVLAAALDVRDAATWEHALDAAEARFGPVDVVMNVAGVLRPAYVVDLEPDQIDLQLGVNLRGVVLGTRAAARRMVPRGRGHVVNVGSLASLAAVPGLSLYSASKFAVRGFSLAAAAELRPNNVFVSLVMPDAVETPMLQMERGFEEAAITFSGDRILSAREVAEAVCGPVLEGRPLELTLPFSRGALARAANTAPALARLLAPALRQKGLKNLACRR